MSYAIKPPSRLRVRLRETARAASRALAVPLRHFPGSSLNFGPPRGIEASAERWLQAHPQAGKFHALSPARQLSRGMPRHSDEPIAALFRQMGRGQIKARAVGDFSGARFWGNAYGCVVTPDDRILHDLSPTFADFDQPVADPAKHDGLFRLKLPPLQQHPGTLAAINTYGHENFHHWLLDTVPSFGLLKEAGIDFNQIDGFLLRSFDKPFNRETLQRLGIPESKIVPVGARTHLLPRRLIVPTFSEPGRQPEQFNYTPEGLRFVRSLFLDGKTASPVDADKIVVSREKTKTRRLMDGDKIHERLRKEGFVKVCLEDFSVAQQAALFQRARAVIMPTGGGLANIVFSDPGTRLIELFSPAYLPTFCLPLSEALGLDYVALVGEDTVGAGHSDSGSLADIKLADERLLEFACGS